MGSLLLPQIPLNSLLTSPITQSPPSPSSILIIGGGLSGLAAATHLHAANLPFLLLESSNALGGRVRTDSLNGFLLDRGFQILLTAYPESRRLLHFPSLNLRPFYPGALASTPAASTASPTHSAAPSTPSYPSPIPSAPSPTNSSSEFTASALSPPLHLPPRKPPSHTVCAL